VPDDDLFAFDLARVRDLGYHLCGRRLSETMLVWETDPSPRRDALHTAFAEVWSGLRKVVFTHTLDTVQGNARLAQGSVAEEIAAARAATENDIEIGGAGLAGTALELGLVDELRIFRHPIIVGGGTPLLPPVQEAIPLELLETRTFASGVVYERHRCIRAAPSRPGA
jgi:dihydrofolate reductase